MAQSLEAQKKGNIKLFQASGEKAKEAQKAALAAVELHFQGKTPFIPKIERKIHELNQSYPSA